MTVKKLTGESRVNIQDTIEELLARARMPCESIRACESGQIHIDGEGNVLSKWDKEHKIIEPSLEDARLGKEMVQQVTNRYTDRALELQSLLDDSAQWERSRTEPIEVNLFDCVEDCTLTENEKWENARLYLFENCLYAVNGDFTEEQDRLLVQDAFDKERRKFEKLKRKFAAANSENSKTSRQPISEEVRIAVWRRDGGACARCGSRERLEYDHIIPVSRGGSSTVRNIELLCEVCNRSKGNEIK